MAPRTILHIHRTLSKALEQATGDGLVPRNAAAPVKPPRPRREEIRLLDRKHVRVLFEAAGEDRLEALYVVAITAGLRRGELQGLKWEDLDLKLEPCRSGARSPGPAAGTFSRLPRTERDVSPAHTEGHLGRQRAP